MQTRRNFLTRAGGSAAVAVLAPGSLAAAAAAPRGSASLFRGGKFAQGVMSGDPKPREITLWTKLSDVSGSGTIRLEVARDEGFSQLVTQAQLTVSPGSDHVAKVRLRGLDEHERYYYRFETRNAQSAAGRFQTALPRGSREPVRFGVFSCQEFSHGYYNAHARLAREDLDFVVNLGNYIYVEDYYTPGSPDADGASGRRVRRDTVGTATTLDEIRAKYDLYRSDASLRAMHQQFPMISVWGDHEVANDFYGSDASIQPRVGSGARAYAENMPTFAIPTPGRRLYQSLRFGRNLELIMLDGRRYRDAQPCDNAQGAPPCAEVGDSRRKLLGGAQRSYVKKRLLKSKATWKVIGTEVPVSILHAPGADDFYGVDSWQGYLAERRRLLEYIKRKKIEDVTFLAGNFPAFYAADIRTDDRTYVAAEFATGPIASENLGESGIGDSPGNDARPLTPRSVYDALYAANPYIDDLDLDRHGYLIVQASPKQLDVTYRRVSTIKSPSLRRAPSRRWVMKRKTRSVKETRRS